MHGSARLLDVNLFAEQDGKREVSVTASDWETIDGAGLLRRLMLHRDDVESICTDERFSIIASNLRDIRDERGHAPGRGAFKRFFHFAATDEDPFNLSEQRHGRLFPGGRTDRHPGAPPGTAGASLAFIRPADFVGQS